MAHGTKEQSFAIIVGKRKEKSNHAITFKEEPSYSIAKLWTTQWELSRVCVEDEKRHHSCTEHTWAGDTGSSCHIINQ